MYLDPITKKTDSERALSTLLRKNLESEMKLLNVNEEGQLSNSDTELLATKLLKVAQEKSAEFGLEVQSIDVRGPFLASLQVPEKLRALEVPPRADNAFGAQLSNGIYHHY